MHVYVADKAIYPDIPDIKTKSFLTEYRFLRHWIISQSTHVVSYVYEEFYDTERMFYRKAKRYSDLEFIDMRSTLTKQAINEGVLTLSAREQLIYQKLDEGCTYKEIATLLRLSDRRVEQLEHRAGIKLRRYATQKAGLM